MIRKAAPRQRRLEKAPAGVEEGEEAEVERVGGWWGRWGGCRGRRRWRRLLCHFGTFPTLGRLLWVLGLRLGRRWWWWWRWAGNADVIWLPETFPIQQRPDPATGVRAIWVYIAFNKG